MIFCQKSKAKGRLLNGQKIDGYRVLGICGWLATTVIFGVVRIHDVRCKTNIRIWIGIEKLHFPAMFWAAKEREKILILQSVVFFICEIFLQPPMPQHAFHSTSGNVWDAVDVMERHVCLLHMVTAETDNQPPINCGIHAVKFDAEFGKLQKLLCLAVSQLFDQFVRRPVKRPIRMLKVDFVFCSLSLNLQEMSIAQGKVVNRFGLHHLYSIGWMVVSHCPPPHLS